MDRTQKWALVVFLALGLALTAGAASAQSTANLPKACTEPDTGSGTVDMPPAGCEYLTADQMHEIAAGLPAGTKIILAPIHTNFICRKLGQCGEPGGNLGGQKEVFTSDGVFQLIGTGTLAGWSRVISVPLSVETHTGPRTPGAVVQSFNTDMFRLQGGISGDPDFQSLSFVGGTANGLPSPGHTTLTLQANGEYLVDSSFSVNFRISFVGAPGGRLAGRAGTTQGKVTMKAYNKCD